MSSGIVNAIIKPSNPDAAVTLFIHGIDGHAGLRRRLQCFNRDIQPSQLVMWGIRGLTVYERRFERHMVLGRELYMRPSFEAGAFEVV